MIDIHCHILPGVDDGARTLDDSIKMARAAVVEGIHTIVATPHHQNNQFNNYREDILTQVNELNCVLQRENIPVNILPGQETRIYGDMVDGLKAKEILPVNLNTPYVLVEFPTSTVPKYTSKLLYDLQLEGYTPIIVHPERNSELISKPDLLYELVKSGVLTQVTAASLLGKFGKTIRKFSHELIESNLVHFIASDAHNVHSRDFSMSEALVHLEHEFGVEFVEELLSNSEDLVKGENIRVSMPEKILRKKFFGFLLK